MPADLLEEPSSSYLGNLLCFDFQFNKDYAVMDEPLMDESARLIDSLLRMKHGHSSFYELPMSPKSFIPSGIQKTSALPWE
jgi:hypothetical protein